MSSNTVLFQQWFFGEVKLQRIVRAQADIQTSLEKVRKRVPFVGQEERVIGQRAHCDTDLLEVEQILECGYLAEENAVGDGVRGQERGSQVVGIPSFAAVGSEDESVYRDIENRVEWEVKERLLKPRRRRQLFKLAMLAYM